LVERPRVRVEGIRFAAGHFATFAGGAEPIHGHSYEVAAELEGEVGPDGMVFDFIELKAILRDICEQIDHRFLLQRDSKVLEIDRTDTAWKVRTPAGVGYVLPAVDVVALPIDNSTAERLAEWIGGQLWESLEERGADNLDWAEIEVWEGPGQRATFRYSRLLGV
jgi:6-pyruvoyl-tetrahydropterin synthase